jgi:hypothetical protein
VATAIFSPFIALKKSMARNEEKRRSNAEGTKKKLGKKGKTEASNSFQSILLLLKME